MYSSSNVLKQYKRTLSRSAIWLVMPAAPAEDLNLPLQRITEVLDLERPVGEAAAQPLQALVLTDEDTWRSASAIARALGYAMIRCADLTYNSHSEYIALMSASLPNLSLSQVQELAVLAKAGRKPVGSFDSEEHNATESAASSEQHALDDAGRVEWS